MNDKQPSKRSPNYPFLSLEDSVEKVRIIYNRDKLSPASPDVIVSHLGYNKVHGTSRRVLSALKEYELLDELSDQRLRVSDEAYKILHSDINSPQGLNLLRNAALKPLIFFNVIEEYKGDLPSDQALSSYLVLERGFTPDGAQKFINVLRETVEFANITPSNYDGENEETQQSPEKKEVVSNMPTQQTVQNNQQQNQFGNRPNLAVQNFGLPTTQTKETILNFKISRKSEARIIFYGEEVTQEAIEQLRVILEAQKNVYPTKDELEAERNQPKKAIWHGKDYDQPVTITGKLGEDSGKQYFSIEESNTGISEDELEFTDEN